MDDNNNQAAMPVIGDDAGQQPASPPTDATQPTGGATDTPATDAGMPTAPMAGANPVTPPADPTATTPPTTNPGVTDTSQPQADQSMAGTPQATSTGGEQSQPAAPVDLSNIQLPGEATPEPTSSEVTPAVSADTAGESGSTDGQPGM